MNDTKTKSTKPIPMPKAAPAPKAAGKSDVCPIPGCNYHYATSSKTGWYKHVASLANHPFWNPETKDAGSRALLFRQEFPAFLPISGAFVKAHGKEDTDHPARIELVKELFRKLEDLRGQVQVIAYGSTPKDRTGT